MSDEQIIAYLQARSRVAAPMDLTQRVMAEVATAPTRRSWFAAFLPAAASIVLVGVVAMVALLVFQAPPSVGPTASPSFPIVMSDPRYAACGGQAMPDQVIAAFPFVAADYQRHFPRMGRSPELEVDEPAFAVVFAVGVQPPSLFVRPGHSPVSSAAGHTVCVYAGQPPDGSTMTYVNVDIAGMRVDLGPSTPPSPTPTASPVPSPTVTPSPPPGYVAVEGRAITVLANTQADALFAEVQTCISGAGYLVEFPASWYTNAATPDTPACTWFAPSPFDNSIRPVAVKPPPPDGVWITLEVFDGSAGYVGETPIYMIEQLSIGGYQGHRAEYGPTEGGLIGSPSEERLYWYVVPFASAGPTFIAGTGSTVSDDYPLAKAVLDRMMASITFQPG